MLTITASFGVPVERALDPEIHSFALLLLAAGSGTTWKQTGITLSALLLHLCLGAANRDPARWERPDEYDITRPAKPTLAFGGGPHICTGMHVARAEMTVTLNALLDRCPNLRLDPDEEPPEIIGMYERGATAIPVLFG